MLLRFLRFPALALLLGTALSPALSAQEEPTVATVVATVNGTDITLGHMLILRAGLPEQYAQVPAQTLFDGILNQLIQQELLSQSQGGDLPPHVQLMIENENRAIIASDVIADVMDEGISEDAIQAAYEAQYQEAEAGIEYSAAHILVETEEEAADLVAKLDEGAEFATLAREFSTGPSGPSGGDLGWFGEGVMVEPFFEAVTALDVGEVSPPVKTDFGWHVIKLKDTRSKERPELEAVRAQLEDVLRNEAIETFINQLEKRGEVDRADTTDLDPAILNDPSLLEQ